MSAARDTAIFWIVALILVALAVICIGGAAIWGVVHLLQ